MKKLSKEEMCQEAADYARKQVLKDCKAVGLTARKTIQRIKDGLDALETKVFYDKDRGKCVVGPDQINFTARAKAVDQAISILDLKAPEKQQIDLTINNLPELIRDARERAAKKS
jgi:hypothetical protein